MRADQIAVHSISLNDQPPLNERLAAIAEAGFGAVEFYLPHARAGGTAAEVRDLLDEHALKCVGAFETIVQCFEDDPSDNHTAVISNAEYLGELGGGVLVVGTDCPDPMTLDDVDVVGRILGRLADQMPEKVTLAIEFNWSPVVRSIRSAQRACEIADHPRVGFLFDTAHFHCTTSKFEDLTEQSVAKIAHVHLNNMQPKPGEHSHCNNDRLLPDSDAGCLDVSAIVRRMEGLGYAGHFCIEMFDKQLKAQPVAEAAARMRQSMQFLLDE